MTIYECYKSACAQLKLAGVDDYSLESKELLKYATGLSNADILKNYNSPLSGHNYFLWENALKRRLKREPLQYIIGEWDFFGRTYKVGKGCLCPRADSETLVETAIWYLEDKQNPMVLDLCAGSGCIGISIAAECKSAKVTLVEKYEDAFNYCKQNCLALAKDNTVPLLCDIYDYEPIEKLDLIVSNPPYVSAMEMEEINFEATSEPETALYGGEDGLDFYRAILIRYKKYLKPGGMLAVEIGYRQGEAVSRLFSQAGFCDIKTEKDLSGNQRVVFGTVK